MIDTLNKYFFDAPIYTFAAGGVLLLLLQLAACTKQNPAEPAALTPAHGQINKQGLPPQVLQLLHQIEASAHSTQVINTLSRMYGQPQWQHSITGLLPPGTGPAAALTHQAETLVLVPLVASGSQDVPAYLACNVTQNRFVLYSKEVLTHAYFKATQAAERDQLAAKLGVFQRFNSLLGGQRTLVVGQGNRQLTIKDYQLWCDAPPAGTGSTGTQPEANGTTIIKTITCRTWQDEQGGVGITCTITYFFVTTTDGFEGGGFHWTGGGIATPNPPPFELEVFVDNPCIKAVINQMQTNPGFNAIKNNLMAWALNTFGSSKHVNLNIRDYAKLPNDRFADWHSTPNGNMFNGQLRLDSSKLKSTTQEFIAYAILHELYHGYLEVLGIDASVVNDHNLFNSYHHQFKTQLQALFPHLSNTQLNALSWAGQQSTVGWASLSPAERADILATINAFQNGTVGTICP